MRKSLIEKVEANFQGSIKDILQELVNEGVTKQTAADRLSVSMNTLLKWIKANGIEWPVYTRERKDKWRQVTAERSVYFVTHNGEEKPLFQAAEEEGLPLNLVLERFKKGDKGERLFRKARSYTSHQNSYNLDLTSSDWKIVCDLAREIGVKRAARKLCLPMSAVSYAMSGQFNRFVD